MRSCFGKLLSDTSGATAVEYSLLLACIFLVLLAGAQAFGVELLDLWVNNRDSIAAAMGF